MINFLFIMLNIGLTVWGVHLKKYPWAAATALMAVFFMFLMIGNRIVDLIKITALVG